MYPSTIHERLERAIREFHGADVQWFQRRMDKRFNHPTKAKKPGTSYQTVLAYVNGKRTPPVEFLKTAADVLGVREAWLICDDGPPRRDEALPEDRGEAARKVAEQSPYLRGGLLPPRREEKQLQSRFKNRKANDGQRGTRFVSFGESDGSVEALGSSVANLLEPETDAQVRLAVDIIGRLAVAPIRVFGGSLNPSESSAKDWNAYMTAILHALSLAISGGERELEEMSAILNDGTAFPPSIITRGERQE